MRIGVTVSTSVVPPATSNPFNTANAFMIGLTDTGPTATAVKCLSITDVTNAIGARSTTNSTLWDAADVYFREGGSILYVSRYVGTTPVQATLTLQDATPHPTVVVTAKYPGVGPNGYNVAVANGSGTTFTATTVSSSATISSVSSFANIGVGTQITGTGIPAGTYVVSVNTGASTLVMSATASASNSGTVVTPKTFTITLTDSSANVLETHGPFINTAALYLDTSSTLVTFAQSAGGGFTVNNPTTLTATALAGGTDDRGTAVLSNIQTALTACTSALGPGQVSVPGVTNTAVSGIWSALGTHAQANNRTAICDMRDGQTAATVISDLGTFGTSGVASYCAFWAGQCIVPGITPGTTRTVPASAVISALCATADLSGNPNQAAAGDNFPLSYVTAFSTNYVQADIDTLNAAGVNTFNTVFGSLQNYGFVTPVSALTDSIYWQFNHARLRMAIVASFQVIGQPFVFSQIDGKGLDIAAFSGALAAELQSFVKIGAIYTQAPDGSQDQGFAIDTGPSVNTPTTIAAGQLGANAGVRMSPFAQLVPISLNAIPITQNL